VYQRGLGIRLDENLATGVFDPGPGVGGRSRSSNVGERDGCAGIFSDLHRPLAQQLGFVPICRLTLWILSR
jgi:hypothetical protein